MSVILECRGKIILHVRNLIFSALYENIKEIVKKTNINLSLDLQELLEKLALGSYGIGSDISDYLKNKDDAKIFANLVNKSILIYEKELVIPGEDIKKALWDFHKELVNYAQELPK